MMKASYVIGGLAFLLGVGLLIMGTSGEEEITALGLTAHARVVKGLGIIAVIFSIITFLVAYGSSIPVNPTDRRR